MNNFKIINGFLIAPLVPCLLWAVLMHNAAILLLAVPIAYLATGLIAVPIYFVLQRFGRVNVITCSIGGLLAGATPPCIYLLFSSVSIGNAFATGFSKAIIISAVFGLIASTSFWFISVKQAKPDFSNPTEQDRANDS